MTKASITKIQNEILAGLLASQKWISSKYFYDDYGSALFEKITCLPEYYLTRTEASILNHYTHEIAACFEKEAIIIEPGAGNCTKIRLLIPTIKPKAYIAQDVSAKLLNKSIQNLKSEFPELSIIGIIGDFLLPIKLKQSFKNNKKYVFYPGSTIGNFSIQDAILFLKSMRALIGSNGGLLLGADLYNKDIRILEAAYNDAQGVTASFNLNILNHINTYLDQKIRLENFRHYAFYNKSKKCIEMYLISKTNHEYEILGNKITFSKNEPIHTENSYKYGKKEIESMAHTSSFKIKRFWKDKRNLFSVSFLSAV